MTEIVQPRAASRPLADAIGPLGDEQAARVLAIFNRYLRVSETHHTETQDAA